MVQGPDTSYTVGEDKNSESSGEFRGKKSFVQSLFGGVGGCGSERKAGGGLVGYKMR